MRQGVTVLEFIKPVYSHRSYHRFRSMVPRFDGNSNRKLGKWDSRIGHIVKEKDDYPVVVRFRKKCLAFRVVADNCR